MEFDSHLALVRAGLGIALVPRLGRAPLGPDLAAVPVADPVPSREIIALHRASMSDSPAIARCWRRCAVMPTSPVPRRQACRRRGVMIRASGNNSANWAAVPNSPDALGVLHHVLRHLVGRGEPGNVLGGPLDADDVPADVGHVEAQGHLRVVADVAQLNLRRLAVDEDRLIVAQQEPHRHAVGPPVRAHGRQPRHQVAAQPPLDMRAAVIGQVCCQVHACDRSKWRAKKCSQLSASNRGISPWRPGLTCSVLRAEPSASNSASPSARGTSSSSHWS